jgi:hypothetical protein
VYVNVEPTPGSLTTVMSPPWSSTICRAMVSPRPLPPVARSRAGSAALSHYLTLQYVPEPIPARCGRC